jgi:hypothetical protein
LERLTTQLELGAVTLAQLDGRTQLQQSIGALEDALQLPIDAGGQANSTDFLIKTAQNPPKGSDK